MNSLLLLAQSTDPWAQEFFGLDRDQRFVILIIGMCVVTTIIITAIAVISSVVHSMHRRRLETDLKREMLDRGMTADDIARVVESTPPTDFLDRWARGHSTKRSG
jgi:hypothetical protein